MPWQPPRFGVAAVPRKKWAPTFGRPDQRKRGRAGQRERAQVIAEEPLCRACLAHGKERATDEVDHIVPLSEGGRDDRANKQGLCIDCHRSKTLTEAAARRRGWAATGAPA
jgi:5-methylcytosine-specific restriction protein A